MSWLRKLLPGRNAFNNEANANRGVPEGVWHKCPKCNAQLFVKDLERNHYVCPQCQHHLRIGAKRRLQMFLDAGSQLAIGEELLPVDFMQFKDTKKYKERLQQAQQRSNCTEALLVVRGCLQQIPVVVCCFEFEFIGGSMGAVVGERFVRAVERCLEEKIPLVCFACSGGARMQEGVTSLWQMAKTSAAIAQLKHTGIPYISVMVDPCMGGVSASLAMLGDINLAEPGALIGFAGPRVIEQTVREKLPEGFQQSEFLQQKGFIDMVVPRKDLRATIARLISKLSLTSTDEQRTGPVS